MKKSYQTPSIEKIEFKYRDQVVASSGCIPVWINVGPKDCEEGNKFQDYNN